MKIGDLVKHKHGGQFGIITKKSSKHRNHWDVFWDFGHSSLVHRSNLEAICR